LTPSFGKKILHAHQNFDQIGMRLTKLSDKQSANIGVPQNGPLKPEQYRY
jgi:adenosylhomocysteinase